MDKWLSATTCTCKKCGRGKDHCTCEPVYNTSDSIDRFYRLISYYPNMRAMDVYDLEFINFSTMCMMHIKKPDDSEYIRFLGYQMALYLKKLFGRDGTFTVTYPPRSLRVRLKEGTDIGAMLASCVAKFTDMDLFTDVRRVKISRRKQKQLHTVQRGEYSAYSFAVSGDIEKRVKNQRFVIIDDAVTTGATATCLATVLKKHGASEVFCMSASRTIYFDKAKDR